MSWNMGKSLLLVWVVGVEAYVVSGRPGYEASYLSCSYVCIDMY